MRLLALVDWRVVLGLSQKKTVELTKNEVLASKTVFLVS